jgi:site-specific recombinase XerD
MSALVTVGQSAPLWGWERIRALVLASVTSTHSRRAYAHALDRFWEWSREAAPAGFTRETVQHYRAHLKACGLAPSSCNLHLTVIRKLAKEAVAAGLLTPELAASVIGVSGSRQKGARLGAWLTLEQAQALLQAPSGDDLRARRDRALLALLIGCGLRRAELAALETGHVALREGRWVLVDLIGKGSRLRSVPMPGWAKGALDHWTTIAEITDGRLFRAISPQGELQNSLTPQAVYLIVRHYTTRLGFAIAPHDLRRTFARLAHNGKAPLEQIQLSLGHDSILTTERYLGTRQNLQDAPCDRLGIRMDNHEQK